MSAQRAMPSRKRWKQNCGNITSRTIQSKSRRPEHREKRAVLEKKKNSGSSPPWDPPSASFSPPLVSSTLFLGVSRQHTTTAAKKDTATNPASQLGFGALRTHRHVCVWCCKAPFLVAPSTNPVDQIPALPIPQLVLCMRLSSS
jgi:hypothetical protein